jgi:hypothetical protein
MANKITPRDPEADCIRKATSARRAGVGAKCGCGEIRPGALSKKCNAKTCQECRRKAENKSITDKHHPFGRANSPITIDVPTNDHCADLNEAQRDWPKPVLKNPDGSPLIAAAGCVLGFIDTVVYLIRKGLQWVAEMLIAADDYLRTVRGEKYWIGTPLEPFAPAAHVPK